MKINKSLLTKLKLYIGTIEFFDFNGYRQIASGSLFHYKGKWLIVTAAHCIFDLIDKKYSRNVSFCFDSKNKVYLRKAYVHKYWIEKEYLEFDIAFLIPDDDYLFKDLDSKFIVPSFKIKERQYGFVCGIGLLRSRPRILYRNIIDDDVYQSNLIGVKTHFYSGMSGGPWYQWKKQKFVLFATSSLSLKSVQNTLWGISWNKEVKNIADVAALDNNDNIVKEIYF